MTTWTLARPTDLTTLDFLSLRGPAWPDIRTDTHYRDSAGALALDVIGHGFSYAGTRWLPTGSIDALRLSDALAPVLQVGDVVWHLLQILSYYNPLTDRWDEAGLLDYLFGWIDDITGSAGDDTFCGHGGDDVLRGGGGIDTALYQGPQSRWTLTRLDDAWRATDNQGGDGSDTLIDVERLRFADGAVALDLQGHAGTVARLVGALFGAEALARRDLVGTGLALLDHGMDEATLAALAADSALFTQAVGSATNAAFVDTVYRHVTGAAPTAEQHGHYLTLLDSGAASRADLTLLAAHSDALAQAVGLAALAEHGLAYEPAG